MILLSYKLLIAHSCNFIGRVHNIINNISSNIRLPVYEYDHSNIYNARYMYLSTEYFLLSQLKLMLYPFYLNQILKKLFSNTQKNFIIPKLRWFQPRLSINIGKVSAFVAVYFTMYYFNPNHLHKTNDRIFDAFCPRMRMFAEITHQ